MWLLGWVSFLNDAASEMVLPLLPLLLTGPLAAPIVVVGLMEGLADATQAIGRAGTGWWSDRMRRRTPFVVAGYAAAALARPMYAFAAAWPTVVGARFVDRAGKGIRSSPRDALIAEASTSTTLGRAFGLHRALDTAGAFVGSALAIALVLALGSEDESTIRTVFLASLVPAALAVALALLVRERRRDAAPAPRAPFFASLRGLPRDLRAFVGVTAIFSFGHLGFAFVVLKAAESGLGLVEILLLYAGFNAVYATASYPAGALADRIGKPKLLLAAYALYALVALAFALASGAVAVVAATLAFSAWMGLSEGLQKAHAAALAPPDLKATALGLQGGAAGLAALPGGLVAGFLWDAGGSGATFAFAALVGAAAFAAFALTRRA